MWIILNIALGEATSAMTNVFDVLNERGYVAQVTHEEDLRKLLGSSSVTFYIGFDCTADSLHVGHLLTIMAMMHMQRHGHKPIALVGGGTTMVGDPSGKTDMRPMLSREEIKANGQRFRQQLSHFLDFGPDQAIMVDNADWLLELKYVDVLREIGAHFSVNRMLTAECFKSRLERGLSFLEFNYMLMQAYDYLELYRRHGCRLQMGGDDQWSNILAGTDLIRRKEGADVYGLTFTLLTTSSGKKMGKTESGAIWLDAEKTSPYEFYQYWRNVADEDVKQLLALFSFLPLEEVERLGSLKGEQINEAKQVLAFEATRIVHGLEAAEGAREAAEAAFGGSETLSSQMPSTQISEEEVTGGISVLDLLLKTGLIASKSEGRRLVDQGGIYVNDVTVERADQPISPDDFSAGRLVMRKGKKVHHQVIIAD